MPEGPEARTIADVLRNIIMYGYIDNYRLTERAKAYNFNDLVLPTQIINVRSYGKKVIIDCVNLYSLVISLGMSGRLQFEPGKHSHISINICSSEYYPPLNERSSNERSSSSNDHHRCPLLNIIRPHCILYFDDTRYFGHIDVVPTTQATKGLGPDLLFSALNASLSTEMWYDIFVRRPSRKKIYDLLTDQSRIAGIGWYLMTDILYYANVHPERLGTQITMDEWENIRREAHRVIVLSYQYKGLTIQDYIAPDGAIGTYERAIYQKESDANGYVVQRKTISNKRTIHWVNELQK